MTNINYDYTGFYTIVLTEYGDDWQETVTRILKDCWSISIANVNILIQTENNETISLYTFFPYTLNYCEHIEPIVHDYFINGTFVNNSPIFPDKFRNFFKCPIHLSTYQLPPFMMLSEQQPNGTYLTGGIEGIMFNTMATHLNFTPIVVRSGYNVLRNVTSVDSGIKSNLRPSLDLVNEFLIKVNRIGHHHQ